MVVAAMTTLWMWERSRNMCEVSRAIYIPVDVLVVIPFRIVISKMVIELSLEPTLINKKITFGKWETK